MHKFPPRVSAALAHLPLARGRSARARLAPTLLAPVLLAGALAASGVAAAKTPTTATCPAPIVSGDTVLCGSLPDHATYLIEVPAHWNHALFLYSHGYVVPGSSNPAQDVGDPLTGLWMLTHGFALAGSSYATTGWALAQALPDQIATLGVFDKKVGKPAKTIAWGHSLGGIITAGLIQRYSHTFNAALPMCGVVAGGVATWNTALDGAFAFKTLVDPAVQIVNISNPLGNLQGAETVVAKAQKTAVGRARLALGAALGDTPGWFTPLTPEPGPTNYSAQEANQFLWDSQVDFPFIFALRAELEARAGGNPSWNTGVNYLHQLAISANRKEVVALYAAAHLNLHADLKALNRATRISANPKSVRYLEQNISFNGDLNIPVLTLHTTGDGLVIPENEQAYASVVRNAGRSSLLRQVFVHRAGHCAFTPAETITAVQALLHRLATGHWNRHALTPAGMNASAKALGPTYNVFFSGGKVVQVAPAYIAFRPTAYPRPFDLNSRIHP